MRIGLADVKKRVVRREGELYLIPQLLQPGDLRAEMGALIALHEEWCGRERGEFPADRPAELIGDYRLAHCLLTTLTESYAWATPSWPGPASADEAAALAARGIGSPGQLRLALYDVVNAQHGGYLAAPEREPALEAFAAELGIARPTLETLLALDADAHARLERIAPRAPSPDELRVRYNRRAVEALLANAAQVEWVVPAAPALQRGTSLGTLLKRMCFLARRMGVYYDVTFAGSEDRDPGALARVAESPSAYGAGRDPGDTAAISSFDRALCVTLYGPQEAFGGPSQYGDRLARLCRALLGYNRTAGPDVGADQDRAARRGPSLAGDGLRGEAQVYLRGRPYRFALDERLLALLDNRHADGAEAEAPLDVTFDSGLERDLYEAFAALERADATHGWRIEREPEPLVFGETILIPDFALTRGGQRVYLEVVGFWSPGYRERKQRKLAALSGRVDLALAVPEQARAEMESVAQAFPVVWFKDRVSPQALVTLLATRYNDFAARRARVRHADVLAEVERRGLLPWAECAAALRAYGRSEVRMAAEDVATAAERMGHAAPVLVEGVGLATPDWLARTGAAIAEWVAGSGAAGLAVSDLVARLGEAMPALPPGPEAVGVAEALAWATGHVVVRASLFEPRVVAGAEEAAGAVRASGQSEEVAQPAEVARPLARSGPQPHRPQRRSKDREQASPQRPALPWDAPSE